MATKEEIWTAATALAEAGERPTLLAVRRAVGGGSDTTISEAMAEWRAKQTQPAPSREPAPESIVSQASDLAAATALAEAGERPTLSAVRRAVGGGSYTTISEAMAEWRARQTQPAPSREPAPERYAVFFGTSSPWPDPYDGRQK